mgnify:CR=1 FL=1
MGADAGSPVFYNRVKGEMEDALAKLGYQKLVVARPSMLDGNRAALAQAARPAEHWGLLAMTLLKPLIPANYRAITATQVAKALVAYPQFNGFYEHGAFRPAAGIHVGWAIAMRGGGLVAPAIHDADRKTPGELMAALRDLVQRARAGGLRSS